MAAVTEKAEISGRDECILGLEFLSRGASWVDLCDQDGRWGGDLPHVIIEALRTRKKERIMLKGIVRLLAVVVVCACGFRVSGAALTIDTVAVGNPGNAGELSGSGAGGSGPDRICGAVDYSYNIGTYEVTAGQYTAFLNAVAATDTYELYNPYMWSHEAGCKIERTGSSGSYTYSVAPDWAERPVNFVSWGDAARFSNWLHNGQPSGLQGLGTTEDGAYFLDGAMTHPELLAITREADATWVIPSEDEWYKAAYHKNDGASGNYFDYPTSSDAVPNNDLIDPDPGNNANFFHEGWTIGGPYWRTEVGEFENSDSPYGTFDQGGNVWEWNETILYGAYRGLRGGAFSTYGGVLSLHASSRSSDFGPTYEEGIIGLRVCEVPEPVSMALLALGGVVVLGRRRR
jgi:sulfatase modifying factor 1